MKIHSLLPHLENQRILRLWHQAQEAQWSALAIDWKAAVRIGEADRDRMARILTPVLMSEQSAMNSAGALFPLVGSREEHESQYYLASWIVDEARHAELFFRMIHRFDREPMSLRRFPEAYYFQSRVYSQDVVLFLAGLLVSEVLAKHSMSEFLRLDIDPALSQICERILDDEARHLGFNHLYLEEHLAGLERVSADESAACAARLTERLDAVLAGLPKFLRALDAETRAIGFQTEAILAGVDEEARTRLRRSIEAGRRKGVPAVPAARP